VIDVLTPGTSGYPAQLGVLSPAPTLHVRGAIVEDDALAIAIVGSRRATAYGVEVAERLASELASRGVTIVSGLARGIDTAAHRGALAASGRTIAVLGSGVDVIYPPENSRLADDIQRHGAVISQFVPGTPPRAWNFPERNRTIAGLAIGVVVVEAAERSGALITAGLAADLGREVFAVPGRITENGSRGANRLLQDGAKLVLDWTDIVQELPEAWRRSLGERAVGVAELPSLDAAAARVLALLRSDEPLHIEQLITQSGMDPGSVGATLVALEVEGRVRQIEGQRWIAVIPRARRA
jgi:DNA processing protein